MKNYYYDLVNFRKALVRNHVQKVFFSNGDFWFFTRKGINIYKSNDEGKLFIWFSSLGIEVKRI